MEPTSPRSSDRLYSDNNEQEGTQKLPVVGHLLDSRKIDKNFIATLETIKIANIRIEAVTMDTSNSSQAKEIVEDKLTDIDAKRQWVTDMQKTQGGEAEVVDAIEPSQVNNSTAAPTPVIQDTP